MMKRKCPVCEESGFPTAEAMRHHLGDQHGGARSATLKKVRKMPDVQRLVVTLSRNSVLHLEIRDEAYVAGSGEEESRKQGQQLSCKNGVLFQPEEEKPSGSSEPAPVLRGKKGISAPGITSLVPDGGVVISPRAHLRGAAAPSGGWPQDLSELATPLASSTLAGSGKKIQHGDGVLKKSTSRTSRKEGNTSQKKNIAAVQGLASPASRKKEKHIKNKESNVLIKLVSPSSGKNKERQRNVSQDKSTVLSSKEKFSKGCKEDFRAAPSCRKKEIDTKLERTLEVKEPLSSPCGENRRKIKEEKGVPQRKASASLSSEDRRRKIDEEKTSSLPRKGDSKKANKRKHASAEKKKRRARTKF